MSEVISKLLGFLRHSVYFKNYKFNTFLTWPIIHKGETILFVEIACVAAGSSISELMIRRRQDSSTADLIEGAWGEVPVATARKIALRKLARRRVVVAPFPVEV